MDPRNNDSDDQSRIYHALLQYDPKILYNLYYFAVNSCCQTGVSFRNPDPNIVSNLKCMEKRLFKYMSEVKDFDMKVKFDELIVLNKFLIELIVKFLEIKNTSNDFESTSDIVFEAENRRHFIVSLLEIYQNFACHPNSVSITLEVYMLYKDYYDAVDMITAILFFENITFLKERLKLTNKKYSDTESSFFVFFMQNLALHMTEPMSKIKNEMHCKVGNAYKYVFYCRLKNLDELKSFTKTLCEITINENNVVNKIPKNEIYSVLQSHPSLKYYLEMNRLQYYFKIIKDIRINHIKEVLVIERVLQVIGEYLPANKDIFSIKRFLSLCLPKNVSKLLRRLRHRLTHLESHAFPYKFECEKDTSLFESILNEIHEIDNQFQPVYQIIELDYAINITRECEKGLQKMTDLPHSYFLFPDHSVSFANTEFPTTIYSDIFESCRSSCYIFLEMALKNLKEQIENKCSSPNSHSHDLKKIIYVFWPLKSLLEMLKECKMDGAITLLDSFIELESSRFHSKTTLKEKSDSLIKECYDFLLKFNVVHETNMTHSLKSVKSIQCFMKILNGSVYLSDAEKDVIKKEIPETIKNQFPTRDNYVQSVEEGIPFNTDPHSLSFERTCSAKNKMKERGTHFQSEDRTENQDEVTISTHDPIAELEKIFTNYRIDNKKKYDELCEIMQFSEKTRKILLKLVPRQRKKVPINNLMILLQRLQLLKTIVIEEDGEVQKLWISTEREKHEELIHIKIVRRSLEDAQFQVAIEMLLFDCMNLFGKSRLPEKFRIKYSSLYEGINMRNFLSHGNPLVQNICDILAPQDLPSEIVKKIILLITDEDVVKAILQLHDRTNKDYAALVELINCDEEDEYCELRSQIRNCNEWKNYVKLLPDSYKKKVT